MSELHRLKLALEKSGAAVYDWDVGANSIAWSGDPVAALGLRPGSVLDCQERFLAALDPEDREKYLTSLRLALNEGGDYSRSYHFRNARQETVLACDRGTVVRDGNRKRLVGTLSRYLLPEIGGGIIPPTHFHKRSSFLLSGEAYAGGPFFNALTQAFVEADSKKEQHVLLKVSIDNLPMMITWYSLEFADRIMSALEIHLAGLLRVDDVIERIGVDQFGIILKHHSESEAELVVDRVLKRIQLYHNPSFDEPIHLRTSIGSVRFPLYADTPQDALNKTYLALASARSKANEFHCDYQDAKREHLDSRDQMTKVGHMRSALLDNRMHLAYQPVIESRTGGVHSYECLLRMEDEWGNLHAAGHFIPVAEKMGMIDLVDQYVLERIIQELQEHRDIRLGFNVSNMTTDNPKWLKMCTRLLTDPSVAARLMVEITETAAQRDMRQTAYFVAALQALGCKVALDDFGAGYTSFRQLKNLSVDMVKIDGTYVIGLEENSENMLFIKTLVEFNHSYGLETIAECVETGEVAKILMKIAVDYMQGHYFGKAGLHRPWLDAA